MTPPTASASVASTTPLIPPSTHPWAEVIHRLGTVPVGETSLFVRVRAPHRSEAFQLLTSFLDRLKQDVPIWKTQP